MIQELIDKYEIKNFTLDEVTHHQDDIPAKYYLNIIPALCVLQRIRTDIMTPVRIYSTFRSPEYNAKVNGAKNSMHLVFNAIDFAPVGYDSLSLMYLFQQIFRGKFACEIEWKGKMVIVEPAVMGTGLYSEFIHIDTRGLLGRRAPARWKEL